MKFFIIASIVALATAAPAPQFFLGGTPFGGVQTYSAGVAPSATSFIQPSTFVSSSAYPSVYSAGVGSGFVGSPIATTYSAGVGSGFVHGSPIVSTYSAGQPIVQYAHQPIVYSAPQVVAAVGPKSVAQTPGSSHIVY